MAPEIRAIIITVSDQLLVVVGAYKWSTPELQLELIPGPLDHLGLFGSSLLVPKQRAVTSTGAYVLMDLGSVVVWPRRFEHQQLIPGLLPLAR